MHKDFDEFLKLLNHHKAGFVRCKEIEKTKRVTETHPLPLSRGEQKRRGGKGAHLIIILQRGGGYQSDDTANSF